MAEREVWIGSVGPFLYEDTETYYDPDEEEFTGTTVRGIWAPQILLDDAPSTANEAARAGEVSSSDSEITSALDSGLTEASGVTSGVRSRADSNALAVSVADSKGISAGIRASQAISKTGSNSVNISEADSSAGSINVLVGVNDSEADSKNDSQSILISTADSRAESAANVGGIGDVVDDTSPQLGGFLDVNGKYVNFPGTLSSDHTYEGITIQRAVGESVVFGDGLYFDWTDKEYKKAKADASGTVPCSVVALESKGDGETCLLLVVGWIRDDSWSFGARDVWVSDGTGGAFTTTQPSGSGDQVQWCGEARSSTVMWFNPSPVVVELA